MRPTEREQNRDSGPLDPVNVANPAPTEPITTEGATQGRRRERRPADGDVGPSGSQVDHCGVGQVSGSGPVIAAQRKLAAFRLTLPRRDPRHKDGADQPTRG